jgi:hypothetical protein
MGSNMSGQAVFLGCLAYTAGRFRQRAAFTLSSALCYICIIYATRLVQHLEASLEEKHECAEFRRYDTPQCPSTIAHLVY